MKCKIIDFKFRDKTKVGGFFAKVKYEKNNRICEKIIPAINSSYYQLFLNSMTYRENCYSCPFANKDRVGDITIGDFWGVGNEHENYLKENNIKISEGVSCILVNSNKGKKLLEKHENLFKIEQSEFSKVSKYNKQLNYPSEKKKQRKKILKKYEKGYKKLDKWYKRRYSLRITLKLILLKYKNLKNKNL